MEWKQKGNIVKVSCTKRTVYDEIRKWEKKTGLRGEETLK